MNIGLLGSVSPSHHYSPDVWRKHHNFIASDKTKMKLVHFIFLGVSGSVSTFHVLQSSSTMVALFLLQVLEMYMPLQTLWRNRTLGPVWFLLFTKKKKKKKPLSITVFENRGKIILVLTGKCSCYLNLVFNLCFVYFSQNKKKGAKHVFPVFLVFENRKQFSKTVTKQSLIVGLFGSYF